jgi:CO/xanthine dehydrogenase Mo-binding subunit
MHSTSAEPDRAVGARVAMLDAYERVTGRVEYVLNVEMPGALCGKILRSPRPHARIVRTDVEQASRVPGVQAVICAHDVRGRSDLSPYYGQTVKDTPILALDRVRYAGEPVAAVAAVDEDAAAEALELINVEYEDLPAVFEATEALKSGAPLIHEHGNLAQQFEIRNGDVERALAGADIVLAEEYRTPAVQGVPLEPHVVVAATDAEGLTVFTNTQTPYATRAQLANIFGVPLSHVRVLTLTLGGGFGAKAYLRIEPLAVLLAQKAGRPVKIVLSRAEEFMTTQRQAALVRITSGARADGTIVAIKADCFYSQGAYMETAAAVVKHGAYSASSAYSIPNLQINVRAAFTNTVPCGPLRAPGSQQVHWARECHIDSLAARLGIDPVEVRLRNMVRSGDRFVLGGVVADVHLPELLRRAVDALPPRPAAPGPGIRIGNGCAIALKTTATPTTSSAVVKLNQDGSLNILTSSVEMGQGARTVLAQIAADEARLPLERVWVSLPDTEVTPFDHATTSSRTTFSMGNAVKLAVGDVIGQLLELAAEQMETSIADLEVAGGRVGVRGVPERSRAYAQVLAHSGVGNLLGRGTFTNTAQPDPVSGEPGSATHYHQAVSAAQVAVDTETGRVRVLNVQAATFAGVMINPTLCELQLEGTMFMGMGQALFEEVVHDAGTLMNASLADYTIPAFSDSPDQAGAILLEDRAAGEVHGIGENVMPAVPPAIANAVANAVGVRIRDLPITPEKVLQAWRASAAG